MKSLRINKDWPNKHKDFAITLLFKRKDYCNKHTLSDYDFGFTPQSHKVIGNTELPSQDVYAINGDEAVFHHLDFTDVMWMELGQPNARTAYIIYAYEKHKNK